MAIETASTREGRSMIRLFLRLNQMYDARTRMQAKSEIELLTWTGKLEVVVASTESSESEVSSVEGSEVSIAGRTLETAVVIDMVGVAEVTRAAESEEI